MTGIQPLLAALQLRPDGPNRFRATNTDNGQPVIFGGQLLAQSLVAACHGVGDKSVKTIHTVFARGGSHAVEVEIDVDPMHEGRAFASRTVTMCQGDRLITRSIVLLSADEPDVVAHADPAPAGQPPSEATSHHDGLELAVMDDVDIMDPDLVGPPDLDVWVRVPDAPADQVTNRALLAYITDGFLIGTAMRPHAGLGQALAHVTIDTSVVSHTLTFHRDVAIGDWLLLSHHSDHVGGGRCHGRAQVFDPDGQMVASYVQDGLLRPRPD